jgi:tripartite ATP-independent transporter DctM subunit
LAVPEKRMLSLIIFLGLLFSGLPIFFAILGGAVTFMLVNDLGLLFDSIPIQFYGALEINGLLAIPLFMLVGEIMNKGGLTNRLVGAAEVLVGRFRGGLAYTNLLTNGVAASILGSATAQISVMSKVMIPQMEKRGYDRAFSGALTASAGMLGPIIPPSMLMIIFGIIALQPIGPLFIAGIVPGLLILFALGVVIFIHDLMVGGLPSAEQRYTRKEALSVLMRGLWPAAIPVVVITGILAGAMTPTEAGGIASVIAAILGVAYRELNWRHVPEILYGIVVNTATVTGLIAAAAVFGWALTFEGVPDQMVDLFRLVTQSPVSFLLLVSVMFLILGCFLEGISVMIVVVPLLMPMVAELKIDPIHFGVVTTISTVVGLLTPPVGPGLYIVMMEMKIPMGPLFRATIPFLLAILISLFLVCVFPELSIWLPRMVAGM